MSHDSSKLKKKNKMMLKFFVFCCLHLGHCVPPPVVLTNAGAIQGVHYNHGESKGAAFYGIPYATQPTGKKRWQPPSPHPKFVGTYNASEPGPACIQVSRFSNLQMSEDCSACTYGVRTFLAMGHTHRSSPFLCGFMAEI